MPKRLFGIVTSIEGKPAAMIVNGFTKTNTAQIAEARGEDGKLEELHAYSVGKTVNMNGLITAATPVEAGSMIIAAGQSYMVDNATQTEGNAAFVDFSLSAQTGDDAIISTIDGKSYDATGKEITATPAGTEPAGA